jgi:hypothetical protein
MNLFELKLLFFLILFGFCFPSPLAGEGAAVQSRIPHARRKRATMAPDGAAGPMRIPYTRRKRRTMAPDGEGEGAKCP